MVACIEIISKELIKPSAPTPHDRKHHKLSFLDQFQPPNHHFPLIFFYQNYSSSSNAIDDHSRRSSSQQHIKQSLADALTKFYPLAGRIVGNVSVHCNDLGALLVEARVQASLSQAIQKAPIEELNQYLPLEPYAVDPDEGTGGDDGVPLLAVQISFFECGGSAIGVCISHKVADMASLSMFLNYWAALSRGQRIDDDLLAQPDFDLAFQVFPGLGEDSPFPKIGKKIEGKEKFVSRRFLIDKEKLAALKELASSEGLKDPTRVEAVSAFIWKQLIEISRARSKSKSSYLISHAVNLRSRIKDLTSDHQNMNNAFGNMSWVAYSSLLYEGYSNRSQELAMIIRNGLGGFNDEYVKNLRDGISYLNDFNKASGRGNRQEMEFCHFTSWCRFPVYELVDYGWGKPISVSTPAFPYENVVILMDTRIGEGIEAWISMSKDDMAMLPDDLLSLETTTIY